MDAQTFLANFGTIAQTPDGINQLRNLILNLAVHGSWSAFAVAIFAALALALSLRVRCGRDASGGSLFGKMKGGAALVGWRSCGVQGGGWIGGTPLFGGCAGGSVGMPPAGVCLAR